MVLGSIVRRRTFKTWIKYSSLPAVTPVPIASSSRSIFTSRSLVFPKCRDHRITVPVHGTRWGSTSSAGARRTPLYDFHVQNDAKMVPFAGYSMPLQYKNMTPLESHLHVRSKCGLFDVGHMVQTIFRGPSATQFLEHLTPSSLVSLSPYHSTLSVLLNENGGIIDDLMITKHSDEAYYVVTNAGCRDKDLKWFQDQLDLWNEQRSNMNEKVEMEILEGWGLVALQGPEAGKVLQSLTSFDLKKLTFGRSAWVSLEGGYNVHVARGGYTGEDGFEISMPPKETVSITELLVSAYSSNDSLVKLAGLAARDSLRIEAGLCLYGNDLDEDIRPVEAGLSWIVGKDRRSGDRSSFVGSSKVLEQFNDKSTIRKRRVGMVVEGGIARHGMNIYATEEGDSKIGVVTSGIPSPTLNQNIAMGYINSDRHGKDLHKKGSQFFVDIRGKRKKAKVVSMPFVEAKYYRGAK